MDWRASDESDLLHVPEIHWDLCRRDVLTLERIRGIPIADHVCERRGGAWIGASLTTTVASVFMPRIAPAYTPKRSTLRPSIVAPRAITCAASCTP